MKDNDSLKVKIPQLRLLLTANCIFNCQWCHSGGEGGAIIGYKKPEYELTHDEIKELISLFVKKGITHIKISGGEPLIRSDVVDIVKTLKSIQGVAYVEIVTRSPELKKTALLLCKAGIDSVTVSIDTLSEERFNKLTGYREESNVLKDIIMGIKLLRKENIPVKINFILQRDNKDEIMNLVKFAGDYGLTLKFIDLMSIDEKIWENKYVGIGTIEEILRPLIKTSLTESFQPGSLGTPMKHYLLQNNVEIFCRDASVGTHYNRQLCYMCSNFPCQDGLMALRLTCDGKIKFCLYRNDNLLDLIKKNNNEIEKTIEDAIKVFAEAKFEKRWSAYIEAEKIKNKKQIEKTKYEI